MTAASAALPTTEFHCAQCGGTLHTDEGQLFLTCPYCGSAVYLDKSKVVFHWSLACTVTPEASAASLRRWMAGNQTVKDLDRKAQVVSQTFQYFPLWYFRAGSADRETIYLEPAAAIAVNDLKKLPLPAGDLLRYDPALDNQSLAPDVSLAAVT